MMNFVGGLPYSPGLFENRIVQIVHRCPVLHVHNMCQRFDAVRFLLRANVFDVQKPSPAGDDACSVRREADRKRPADAVCAADYYGIKSR